MKLDYSGVKPAFMCIQMAYYITATSERKVCQTASLCCSDISKLLFTLCCCHVLFVCSTLTTLQHLIKRKFSSCLAIFVQPCPDIAHSLCSLPAS